MTKDASEITSSVVAQYVETPAISPAARRRKQRRVKALIAEADRLLGPPAPVEPSPGELWRPRLPGALDAFEQPLDPLRVLSFDGGHVAAEGAFRFGRGSAIYDLRTFRGLYCKADPDLAEWRADFADDEVEP